MAFIILSNIFLGVAKLHVLGIKKLGTLGDVLITAKKKQRQKNPIRKKYTEKKTPTQMRYEKKT